MLLIILSTHLKTAVTMPLSVAVQVNIIKSNKSIEFGNLKSLVTLSVGNLQPYLHVVILLITQI